MMGRGEGEGGEGRVLVKRAVVVAGWTVAVGNARPLCAMSRGSSAPINLKWCMSASVEMRAEGAVEGGGWRREAVKK